MKHGINKLLMGILLVTSLGSCASNTDAIAFNEDNLLKSSFGGIGVEWGTYEDTKKLIPDYQDKIIKAVDYLKPSIVRCMFNYDWIVGNLDDKGNEDKTDDIWTYDFAAPKFSDLCEVLDYCQDHNIDVAFGGWNVIGNADEELDEWNMIKENTADLRWAKMTKDILNQLVNNKGYTCIKWFVNTNEPNWTGTIGSSKMAYNTYEKWEQGVRNVRAALDEVNLQNIDIVGGDTTGFGQVALEYMENISKNLTTVVNNYGAHFYVGNIDLLENNFKTYLTTLYDGIKANDARLGDSVPFYIWESGLLDGKNVETDCQAFIQNYNYGYRMADYTVQAILSGVDGVCYWDLDDAMHFMYTNGIMTPKEWGMFSTLASASIKDQEYRPWYYSSVLLSHALKKGNLVYKPNKETDLNIVASKTSDGKDGYIVAVNHTQNAIDAKLLLESAVSNNEKTYVYIYKEGYLKLDSNGKIVPNQVINKSINNIFNITIPTNSLVVISSSPIGA